MKISWIVIYLCFLSCSFNENKTCLVFDNYFEKASMYQKTANIIYNNYEHQKLITPGVLRIRTDILEQQDDTIFLIYNGDTINSLYACQDSAPMFFNSTVVNIRSYYPDFYVVVLDSYEQDNDFYKVWYNNKWVLVPHEKGITIYEDWETHLKKTYIVTDNSHPLSVLPEKGSTQLHGYDYSDLNFICEKVTGDWIYVICNADCEGCPTDEIISGWIKWRDEDQLLIRIYYTC